MKIRSWPQLKIALLCVAVLLAAYPSFSQNSRPRYSNPTTSQRTDAIAVDTVISLRMNDNLSSRTARVGDRFTATVTVPVHVAGRVAIPAGAVIAGRVTQVTPARRMNKSGILAVEFDEITLPNGLSTQIIGVLTSDDPETQKQLDEENRVSGGKGKDSAVFIGGSGVLGAILGGVAGGGKGAAVGGAVGAGIGAASVLFSKGEEATVSAGTSFGLRLKQSLPVPDDGTTNPSDSIAATNSRPSSGDSTAEDPLRSSRPTRENETSSDKDSRPILKQPSHRTEEGDPSPVVNSPPVSETNADEPQPVEENLPLSSPEMIRRAQTALNQEGYYEGEIDGDLNPRTVKAITIYQWEKKLTETGTLDEATATSLGIRGSRSSQRQVPSSAPPTRTGSQAGTSPRGSAKLPSSSTSDQQVQVPVVDGGRRESNSMSTLPTTIQSQANDLLSAYQSMIGVRLTGTGIELDNKSSYSDEDINLLFAIDSFVNSIQLYVRILPNLQSQSSARGATLSMAKEARRTDRVFTTSSSRWINNLNTRWDLIRQNVLKLMYYHNLSPAALEN